MFCMALNILTVYPYLHPLQARARSERSERTRYRGREVARERRTETHTHTHTHTQRERPDRNSEGTQRSGWTRENERTGEMRRREEGCGGHASERERERG